MTQGAKQSKIRAVEMSHLKAVYWKLEVEWEMGKCMRGIELERLWDEVNY